MSARLPLKRIGRPHSGSPAPPGFITHADTQRTCICTFHSETSRHILDCSPPCSFPCVLFVAAASGAASSEGRGACRRESLWRRAGSRDRMKIKVGVDVRSVNPKALTFSTGSRTQTLPFPCLQRQWHHFLFGIRVYIFLDLQQSGASTAFCEWHKDISLKSGHRCEPSSCCLFSHCWQLRACRSRPPSSVGSHCPPLIYFIEH